MSYHCRYYSFLKCHLKIVNLVLISQFVDLMNLKTCESFTKPAAGKYPDSQKMVRKKSPFSAFRPIKK